MENFIERNIVEIVIFNKINIWNDITNIIEKQLELLLALKKPKCPVTKNSTLCMY